MTEETEDVIEGTATEAEPELPAVPETDLVVTENPPPPGHEVLMPGAVEDVIRGMSAYQEMLPKLLDANDYQQAGSNRRFVKKSGWRKIARAFNLSVQIVSMRVERDADGNPTRAECIARAIAPNGQVSDGDGYCAADEKRFGEGGGKAKLENDLRTTATTRAKNRAIADLVGMGEVSAEEMEGPTAQAVDAPQALKDQASTALTLLIGDVEAAREAWGAIKSNCGNAMPTIVAHAIIMTANQAAAVRGTEPAENPDQPELGEEPE